jgi:p-hydroxybenzoate 3-monooxygenase
MKTQVVIIGGGPSGLLLSQLLNRAGVETVILERTSRARVLERIRAGVLEWGTVEMLREAGVAARMEAEGKPHDGCYLTDDDMMLRIDFHALTGRRVMVYGQTEVTADLYAAQTAMGVAGGVLLANAVAGMFASDAQAAEAPTESDQGMDDTGFDDDSDW